MALYMYTANYTQEAMQALVAKPQDREPVIREFVKAAGGKLHHLYFAMGATDIVVIAEFPDDKAIAGLSLAVGASGTIANGATTKLLTSKEFLASMRKAKKIAKDYTPPHG